MLVGMWKNWIITTQLVKMTNGEAGKEFAGFFKNETCYYHMTQHSWALIPEKEKTYVHTNTCT